MAGLLDFLQGGDNQLGLALLAAGAPTTDPNAAGFGYRLANAVGQAQAQRDAQSDRLFKQRLQQSQINENASQAEQRKQATALAAQKAAFDQYFLTGGAPPMAGGDPTSPAPTVPLAGAASFGGMTAPQIAQKFNLPVEQVIADYKMSGGKNIANYINDRTKPNIQLVNGTPVDLNRVDVGKELPGYRAGQLEDRRIALSGTLQRIPQPDGSDVVVPGESLLPPPAGSATARPVRSPMIATSPSGPTNSTERGMRDTLGNMSMVTDQLVEQTKADIAAGRITNPQDLANAKALVEGRDPGGLPRPMGPVIGLPPGAVGRTPSTAEKNAADVQKAAEEKKAALEAETAAAPQRGYNEQIGKQQADRREAIFKAGASAGTTIAKLNQVGDLLAQHDGGRLSEKGMEIASTANSLGLKIDKNLANKEAAASMSREMALELRNPAGGAGMPGSMSDSDRQYLVSMTPSMSQSAEGRRKIIEARVAIETRNQQIAEFARKYEGKYKRLDNGFEDQLAAWSKQNPLFGGKK